MFNNNDSKDYVDLELSEKMIIKFEKYLKENKQHRFLRRIFMKDKYFFRKSKIILRIKGEALRYIKDEYLLKIAVENNSNEIIFNAFISDFMNLFRKIEIEKAPIIVIETIIKLANLFKTNNDYSFVVGKNNNYFGELKRLSFFGGFSDFKNVFTEEFI